MVYAIFILLLIITATLLIGFIKIYKVSNVIRQNTYNTSKNTSKRFIK